METCAQVLTLYYLVYVFSNACFFECSGSIDNAMEEGKLQQKIWKHLSQVHLRQPICAEYKILFTNIIR
jgi:hypothetical protein